MRQGRQGDVLITKVECVPEGAKPMDLKEGKVVMALGEVSGHSHQAEAVRAWEGTDGALYFEIPITGAKAVHEEHGTIPGLEPMAIYRSQVPQQWDYDLHEPVRVSD